MTPTQKGNILIAKFCGWVYRKKGYNWVRSRILYATWVDEEKEGHKDLLFHKSWDWMMPVVYKIMRLKLKPDEDRLFWRECDHYTTPIFNAAGSGNMKELFPAVVEFVKWYSKEN